MPERTVLVTGAKGYLGSVLMSRLDRLGYRTVGVDNAMVPGVEVPLQHGRYVAEDIRQVSTWQSLLAQVDAVIHLAAIVGDPACGLDPHLAWETNYHATAALVTACKHHGVRDLLFASTCSSYGTSNDEAANLDTPLHPQSLYAQSKIFAELHLLANASAGFRPRILRLSTLYGRAPRMRFDLAVNAMTADAITRQEIRVHGGTQWRPFLHVADAATAFLQLLRAESDVRVWNCGSSSQNYRIAEIAKLIAQEVPRARMVLLSNTADARDYLVDFADIHQDLGFTPSHTVEAEVRELARAIRSRCFGDCRQHRYSNVESLRSTLAERKRPAARQEVPQLFDLKE